MTDEEQIVAATRAGFEAWSAWDIDQLIDPGDETKDPGLRREPSVALG